MNIESLRYSDLQRPSDLLNVQEQLGQMASLYIGYYNVYILKDRLTKKIAGSPYYASQLRKNGFAEYIYKKL